MRALILAFLISLSSVSFAQHWKQVDESIIPNLENLEKEIYPSQYSSFELDLNQFRKDMKNAPEEYNRSIDFEVDFPTPDGETVKMHVEKSSIMMPGLAAKYPSIQSYRLFSKNDPYLRGRMTVTNDRTSAAINSKQGEFFIDQIASNHSSYYQVYFRKDDPSYTGSTQCGLGNYDFHNETENDDDLARSLRAPGEIISLRRYRMAIACTGEWGNFQGGAEEALELMVETLDKANLTYENELSIMYMLIDNNDLLVQTDGSTDPYENANSGGSLIGQNTSIVNALVGANTYDIGHIFARCTDVGGIASLSSLCAGNKASGGTCYFGTNASNGVLGTFMHEVGHQMSANHTMNNCNGNENPGTSYEVGSGSTLMSYSGLCGSLNTGNDFVRYHSSSLQEIFNHTRNGGNGDCGVKEDIGNHAPDVLLSYEDDFYIPISTPFSLTGDAADTDGDFMTYTWEQYDLGPIYIPGSPVGNVPIFETVPITSSKTRYFPKVQTVLTNSFDNFELLPAYDRDLSFRFVVRDNHPGGGLVSWEDVEFKATTQAGPFRVEYPNQAELFEVGEEVTIEWDVANTDGDLVNCQKVNIVMSLDAGLSWGDVVLASNIDNDGSHTVTIPNYVDSYVRFIVEANDNIFYDMSNDDCRIIAPSDPTFYADVFPKSQDICLPTSATFTIENEAFGGFQDPVSYSVSGLPLGATASFSGNNIDPNEDVTMDIDLSNVEGTAEYVLTVEATAGSITQQREVVLNVTGTDFSPLAILTPAPNESGVNSLPLLSWVDVIDAETYDLQMSTEPAFIDSLLIVNETGLTTNSYTHPELLDKNSLYYWRVKANNKCRNGEFLSTHVFGTETLSCNIGSSSNLPLNISQSGSPTIEATIPVTSNGEVADVVVSKIKGLHDKVSDIAGILVSPAGTEVILWEEKCGNSSNYNVGFNDDAANTIQCPMNSGTSFKPDVPLATFAGEEAQGVWVLRIEDRDPGNGGTLDIVEIEICSNASLDPPVLVNNNTIGVPPESGQLIESLDLLTEDPDNTSQELTYTIVHTPNEGEIYLSSTALAIGDVFTQADVDANRLRYRHSIGSTATLDQFDFTVNDGNGGWIGVTTFNIEIDESFTSSNNNIEDSYSMEIFPNPAIEKLNVALNHTISKNARIKIYSIQGKEVNSLQVNQQAFEIEIGNLAKGPYILEYRDEDKNYSQRFVKLK